MDHAGFCGNALWICLRGSSVRKSHWSPLKKSPKILAHWQNCWKSMMEIRPRWTRCSSFPRAAASARTCFVLVQLLEIPTPKPWVLLFKRLFKSWKLPWTRISTRSNVPMISSSRSGMGRFAMHQAWQLQTSSKTVIQRRFQWWGFWSTFPLKVRRFCFTRGRAGGFGL